MASRGFVTISDANYFPGVIALVNSIRANSPAPITVIDEGLLPEQRSWLDRHGVDHRRVERTITVNSERFGCCYALFDADAAGYDRMVVIDPDTLVLADVSHLFDMLDQVPIAAMADRSLKSSERQEKGRPLSRCLPRMRHGRLRAFLARHPRMLLRAFDPRFRALNSGVVAIRRDLLPHLRSAAEAYAGFFEDFRLPDQNLLSLCLADLGIQAMRLAFQDNAINLHLADADGVPASEREAARRLDRRSCITISDRKTMLHDRHRMFGVPASLDIRIVHFVGARKPWQPNAPLRPGFRELWERYWRLQQDFDASHPPGTTRETPAALIRRVDARVSP